MKQTLIKALLISPNQDKYKALLYRYLRHTRGLEEGPAAYLDFMNMVVSLKEMSEMIRNRTILAPFAAF
jgi:hypothetical protein